MTSKRDIISDSAEFVKAEYARSAIEHLHYHNWPHTLLVWNHAKELAANSNILSNSELEALELAAIYHDIGHAFGSENHEKDSAEYARKALLDFDYPQEKIPLVESLIMATKMGYAPKTELEKIMKDADLAHLKNKDYIKTTYCDLYKELKATHKKNMSHYEWAKMLLWVH